MAHGIGLDAAIPSSAYVNTRLGRPPKEAPSHLPPALALLWSVRRCDEQVNIQGKQQEARMYPAKPDPNATASQPAAWTPAPPVTGMAPPPATGIPINVPSPVPAGPVAASQWSSGLCDCSDDCGLCCLTCWCPCITFGRIAEIVDRGATSCGLAGTIYTALLCFTGCQWVYSCTYRAKMRAQHGLPDVGCCDCCVHFCCEPCALCQQYRELKHRGFDPDLGWDINAQKRAAANAAGMYPPAAQGMGR